MIERGLLPALAMETNAEQLFVDAAPSKEARLTEPEKEDVDDLFFHFVPAEIVTRQKQMNHGTKTPKPRKIQRKCHVDPGMISVQLDEVLTKSQEKGRKANLTGSATIEDDAGRIFYLTAGSTDELLRLPRRR